ncbi:oligosaccharide flippase family protein [Rhodocyclaceae bacterium SMB388]
MPRLFSASLVLFQATNPTPVKLTRIVGIGTAFGLLSLVAQAFSVLIVARYIGAEEYGVVTATLAIIAFSHIFTELGLAQALIQRKRIRKPFIATALYFSVGVATLIYALLYANSARIADMMNMPELGTLIVLGGATFIARAYGSVFEALAYRKHLFTKVAQLDFFALILGYVLTAIPMAVNGFGGVAVIVGAVVQQFTRSALLRALTPYDVIAPWDNQAFLRMFYFGFWFSVARILNYAATQIDNLIVGKFLGAEALGYYGRIFQIIVAPATQTAGVLSNILYPIFSKRQSEVGKLSEPFLLSVKSLFIVTTPIAVSVCIFADPLVTFLLGEAWAGMILPLQILALSLPARAAYKAADPVFKAMGYLKSRSLIQFIYAVLVITSAVIGSRFGLEGVAFLVTISIFIHFTISIQGAMHILQLPIQLWSSILVDSLRFLIFSSGVALLGYAVLRMLELSAFQGTVMLGLILIICYASFTLYPNLLFSKSYSDIVRSAISRPQK